MPQILTHISTEYVGDTLADPYLIAEVLAPHLNAREVLPIVLFLHDQGHEHAAMHLLAAWEAHDEDARAEQLPNGSIAYYDDGTHIATVRGVDGAGYSPRPAN